MWHSCHRFDSFCSDLLVLLLLVTWHHIMTMEALWRSWSWETIYQVSKVLSHWVGKPSSYMKNMATTMPEQQRAFDKVIMGHCWIMQQYFCKNGVSHSESLTLLTGTQVLAKLLRPTIVSPIVSTWTLHSFFSLLFWSKVVWFFFFIFLMAWRSVCWFMLHGATGKEWHRVCLPVEQHFSQDACVYYGPALLHGASCHDTALEMQLLFCRNIHMTW